MAFVLLAAISAVVVLAAGFAMYVSYRWDPPGRQQGKRQAPYSCLGAGLVVLIAGWFGHAGAASGVQMAAGALLAFGAACLAVRNRSLPRG